MKLEKRIFEHTKFLLLIPENEDESKIIDEMLGDTDLPINVIGQVRLSDDYAEHYISIRRME